MFLNSILLVIKLISSPPTISFLINRIFSSDLKRIEASIEEPDEHKRGGGFYYGKEEDSIMETWRIKELYKVLTTIMQSVSVKELTLITAISLLS